MAFVSHSNISLTFGHLPFSLMKQKITAHLSVKFLCFWSECGFDCRKKCFVDKNFGLFCITVINRVLLVVQEGRDMCLGSGEVSSKTKQNPGNKKSNRRKSIFELDVQPLSSTHADPGHNVTKFQLQFGIEPV
jgi:hypothetical protein